MKKISFLIFIFSISCSSSTFPTRQKTVAPFDGRKFQNIEPFPDNGLWDVLKWKFKGLSKSKDWPKYKEIPQLKVERSRSEDLVITVINHATVLIQLNNLNIITDPHFSKRASPVKFAGPSRVVNPGISFNDLPTIDIVLISHNHYDHLDLDTLGRLKDKFNPRFYAGLGTKEFLTDNSIPLSFDLDWWESFQHKNVNITFVPAQHWSARGLFDKREMLWGGFYIEGTSKVYFAGDTGYGIFFKEIRKKLGAPDVSLLPIGAYKPRWFMKYAHMNPDEAVQASIDLESKKSIGMHFGTFKLTDEGIDRPSEDLLKALKKKKISLDNFLVPVFGKAIN